MRNRSRIVSRLAFCYRVIIVVTICCCPVVAQTADLPLKDQHISLDVRDMPLGDVLAEIERVNGCEFTIDEQWKKVPVSVTFYKAPLDRGLKRILANLNNVIIYGADTKIKIIIFGKSEPSATSSRPGISRSVYPRGPQIDRASAEPEQPISQEASPSEETVGDEQTSETNESEEKSEDETDGETQTEDGNQSQADDDTTEKNPEDNSPEDSGKSSDDESKTDDTTEQSTQ